MANQPRWIIRARVARWVFAIAAAVCLIGHTAMAERAVLVLCGSWALGVSSSCLEVGRDPQAREWGRAPGEGLSVVYGRPWSYGSFGSAWRPFRAGGQTASRMMFPLWQPMVAFGVLAAWAHGLAVGGGRMDRSVCAHCGYPMHSLPRGQRRCPECGQQDGRTKPAVAA